VPRILDHATEESGPASSRDEIPWPALENLTPTNLKRTVSTMMKEWEKSLTPAEERQDPISADSDSAGKTDGSKDTAS
jgi:hypothetical protein